MTRKKSITRSRPRKSRSTKKGIKVFFRNFWKRTKRQMRPKNLVKPFILTSVWTAIFIIGAYFYYSHDLPGPDKLNSIGKSPNIRIYSSDGKLISDIGGNRGDFLKYEEIPSPLINAVIATEDRRFFEHSGVDVIGIFRAMGKNLMAGRVVQGGSTITQQLAKNVFLSPERTFKRKIQELLMAKWIEEHYSKQQIITLYLNVVYFGAGNYGIDAASRSYFGKSARYLDMEEAALIAGLLKAPSRYSPFNNIELANLRANQVMENMVEAGYIKKYKRIDLLNNHRFTAPPDPEKEYVGSKYFVDWIVSQIPEYINAMDSDLIITTTLDSKMQKYAEKSLQHHISQNLQQFNASQGAALAMSPDGGVLAMVGGFDYMQSQFNRATQALRQPGSSFKFFVYLTAAENGVDMSSEYMDEPIMINGWSPSNNEGKSYGIVDLKTAFAYSINTVAVKLQEQLGRNNVVEMAKRLGVTSNLHSDPSLALGTQEVTLLEMVQAYAHMASMGRKVEAYGIQKISAVGGEVLYDRGYYLPPRILQKETVYKMNELLMGVIQHGTGREADISRPAGGKTGTTQNYRDAWFIGFTPQVIAGVWVGNDDSSSMNRVSGSNIPSLIWRDFMTNALYNKEVADIPTDSNVFGFMEKDKEDVGQQVHERESFWRRIIGF